MSHVVIAFTSCLEVPCHASNDSDFVTSALVGTCLRDNRILDLVEDASYEDPFAALGLLQVCGVQSFGHIITIVPPPLVYDFATTRDDAVTPTLATIQH